MNVPLIWRNLLYEKGKLIISIASIAAALALILLLLGFRAGLYVTLTAFVDHIGADVIVAQNGTQGMLTSNSVVPLNLHDEAAATVKAQEAGHIIVASTIFTYNENKTPVLLVGYDPFNPLGQPWNLGQGRGVQADNEILLDTWLAQRNSLAVGDSVHILGQRFVIVGLTRETASWMSPYIFVSLDAAASALGLSNMASYHLLRLSPGIEVSQAIETIEQGIAGIEALTPQEIAEADQRVLATIMDTPLNVMIVIGLVIGVAVMGLTAYTAVIDDLQEYGVLKAVGISGRRLSWLVILETFYRAMLGFVTGIGLAYAAAALIMSLWPQFTIVIQPQTIVQAGWLTLIMTFLAVWLPIQRLNQIDPLLVFKQ